MKTIYDSKGKQINFLDERFYTLDNINYYPSVTTVLEVYPKGYGYSQWLKDLGMNADEVLKRAGEQGSKVHDAIDRYLKGEEVSWTDENEKPLYTLEEWQMILRFVEFWNIFKPEIIANEVQVVSLDMQMGGTIDLVCRINGQIWLIDYKTSNAIHTTYELQIAAYAEMWNAEFPDQKIERAAILWVKALTRGADKSGKKVQGTGWILKEFDRSYQDAYKIFLHARAIWDEENPTYKPKNKVFPSVVKKS